ncbi:MAG: MATE family efflux transporter [Puniceicoccales bacterium]|jgi:MATE family multidrug resistance protein|nr:MATE family efflux transporter [Puniceicoccales bacterium]
MLTKYKPGSVAELWAISWPMMMAALSNYFMTLVDRIILIKYSIDAFNAASCAHPFYWSCMRTMMSFIAVTSVFVGYFNGTRKYHHIGNVVWQTIFVSFAYWIILIPMMIYAKAFLAEPIEALGTPYLRIILAFLPFSLAGFGSIGSFFVGRGDTLLMPLVLIISNLVNIIADVVLVFGKLGMPEMGIKGAAYATGISNVTAFIIFLMIFLRKNYAEKFHTNEIKLSPGLLKKCFSIGFPSSMNSLINSIGTAVIFQIIAKFCTSDDLVYYNIASSIYMFFWFVLDGIGKGVCSISSNSIGSGELQTIKHVFLSSLKITCLFAVVTSFFMIINTDIIMFMFSNDNYQKNADNILANMLIWTWVNIVIESIRWTLQNILISAGDTKFTTVSNITCFWFFAFAPISVLICKFGYGALICWPFFAFDNIMRIIPNIIRVTSLKFKNKAMTLSYY